MNRMGAIDGRHSAFDRLDRAGREMPVLRAIQDRHGPDRPLDGERIALCGHITEATAIQVRTLRELGAEIAWCASSPTTTDEAIRDAMAGEVAHVDGRLGMSAADLEEGVVHVLTHFEDGPTLVLDEGARLLRAMHDEGRAPANEVRLAAEKTPEGIEIARGLTLTVPVLDSDMSVGKRLVDNPHGTAQSLLDTIMTVTRGLMAGKVVLVCGYGRVGAGVAVKARGLGARVLVSEVRPTRALVATLDGFEVLPLAEALPSAQIVLTITGRSSVLQAAHFGMLGDGAILINGGHLRDEIDVAGLQEAGEAVERAPGIVGYHLASGACVDLIADGNIANLTVGPGNPNEVMDTTFASQVMALIVGRDLGLAPGLHPLPKRGEAEISRMIAQALRIDTTGLA